MESSDPCYNNMIYNIITHYIIIIIIIYSRVLSHKTDVRSQRTVYGRLNHLDM